MDLPKRKITPADIGLIAVLVLLLALFAVRTAVSPDAGYFTVSCGGHTENYPLSGSGSLSLESEGISVSIAYGGGEVRIERSGCPDQTCVKTGAVSKPGEAIVCVPAGLAITVGGESEGADETYIVG